MVCSRKGKLFVGPTLQVTVDWQAVHLEIDRVRGWRVLLRPS